MKTREKGFFDEENRLSELSRKGDFLEELNSKVKWERFRKPVERVMREANPKGPGGRPPNDAVVMVKTLILRELYQLSDDSMEYQIMDRLSFQRFLGLSLSDDAPDAKAIWHYRNELTKNGGIKKLFALFYKELEKRQMIANKGVIVDASFSEVPRQRNSRDENKEIKEGSIPEEWQKEENKAKLRQKDTDARWTKKNGQSFYGYKNHVKVDSKSKIIKSYAVTSANVHDSQELEGLVDSRDTGQAIYGDSAYRGEEIEKVLKKKKLKSRIHEKGYRDHSLTKTQQKRNTAKSRTRVRVEHVFGFMENTMKITRLRARGKPRIEGVIGMINLTYNICRYVQLAR
ncbi:MAG: IS5 family transposase [Spirochaetales bacterium]|jgi:transposase, IS5 family|nr:IS5 family transposase [Spirochaetales bacterium]